MFYFIVIINFCIFLYLKRVDSHSSAEGGGNRLKARSPTTNEHKKENNENPKKKVRRILQYHHGVERNSGAVRDSESRMEQEKPQPE